MSNRFVGSKAGEGVYQRIISWLPPHDLYVEPFCGRAAIWRHKRPARESILIDSDPGALDALGDCGSAATLICGDGIDWLRRFDPRGRRVLVYADPPYPRESRRDARRDYYRHDWGEAEQQAFLDAIVAATRCHATLQILVSSYWSELYARELAG